MYKLRTDKDLHCCILYLIFNLNLLQTFCSKLFKTSTAIKNNNNNNKRKLTVLAQICSYIFHALAIQVIKQHSDTSVIYYPNRFPTSFNQTLLKPADSERNPLFSCLCLCLSPQLHSALSLFSLSLCLLYSYFPKSLFHICSGPGGHCATENKFKKNSK